MKLLKYIYISLLLLPFLAISCYEDLGNYEYKEDVNTINVKVDKIYGVVRKDTLFVIRPKITQTKRDDNSNLRYAWRVNTEGPTNLQKGDTLSLADTLAIKIDLSNQEVKFDYWIRFYVKDTITKMIQMYPIKFSVIKPYQGAWMVLHEKDKKTMLGSIEYIGQNPTVKMDAYYNENKKRLQGMPVALGVVSTKPGSGSWGAWGYDAASVFMCFTSNPNESGLYRQDVGFKLHSTMNRLIFAPDLPLWNPNKIKTFEGDGSGSIAISEGKVFQGSLYGPNMYNAPASSNINGDYYISHASTAGANHLLYDSLGTRFLKVNTSANYYSTKEHNINTDFVAKINPIKKTKLHPAGANVDNIGKDKEMTYVGTGYWYGKGQIGAYTRIALYALALSNQNDSVYVYEFHARPFDYVDPSDPSTVTGYYKFIKPEGITKTTPCASSLDYNRFIFYGSGNKIYRFDFGSSSGFTAVIYEHPDPNMKVKKLTFAKKSFNSDKTSFVSYGHELTKSLGIAFESSSGEGEVVILNLNSSGVIDKDGKYPSIQKYKNFGKITDIKFI